MFSANFRSLSFLRQVWVLVSVFTSLVPLRLLHWIPKNHRPIQSTQCFDRRVLGWKPPPRFHTLFSIRRKQFFCFRAPKSNQQVSEFCDRVSFFYQPNGFSLCFCFADYLLNVFLSSRKMIIADKLRFQFYFCEIGLYKLWTKFKSVSINISAWALSRATLFVFKFSQLIIPSIKWIFCWLQIIAEVIHFERQIDPKFCLPSTSCPYLCWSLKFSGRLFQYLFRKFHLLKLSPQGVCLISLRNLEKKWRCVVRILSLHSHHRVSRALIYPIAQLLEYVLLKVPMLGWWLILPFLRGSKSETSVGSSQLQPILFHPTKTFWYHSAVHLQMQSFVVFCCSASNTVLFRVHFFQKRSR